MFYIDTRHLLNSFSLLSKTTQTTQTKETKTKSYDVRVRRNNPDTTAHDADWWTKRLRDNPVSAGKASPKSSLCLQG